MSVVASGWSDDYIDQFIVDYMDYTGVWHNLVSRSGNLGIDVSYFNDAVFAFGVHVYIRKYDAAGSANTAGTASIKMLEGGLILLPN